NALVAGPSGDRIQALANIIAGEASANTGEARRAVLERFGAAYNADFYLFTVDDTQFSGPQVDLPPEVRAQVAFRLAGIGPAPVRPGFPPRAGSGRRPPRSEADAPRGNDPVEDGPGTLTPAEPLDRSSPAEQADAPELLEKRKVEISERRRGGPVAGRREP